MSTARSILAGAALALLLGAAVSARAWEQTGPQRFSGVERIVAVGDVHGAADALEALLRDTGIIDAEGRWSGGEAHLVSLGDLVDRGPDSRRAMDLLRRLEGEAQAAGGRVHVVLGNHEIMNLSGELEYVHPGEFASYRDLEPAGTIPDPELPPGFAGHRRAFASDGAYGSWLLEKPVAVIVDDTLFIHAGLSVGLMDFSLESLNERARTELIDYLEAREALEAAGALAAASSFAEAREQARALAESEAEDVAAPVRQAAGRLLDLSENGLVFAADGPLWYRRTALCHPYTEQQVTEGVLEALGAERVVVGHTPTTGRRVQTRMDGQVVLLDTGMNVDYYEGEPAALVFTGDRMAVRYENLEATAPQEQTARLWDRPYGLDDAGIEAFLATGEIVQVEDLATGITKPRRLTLRRGDQEIRAVFKVVDTDPGLQSSRWSRSGDRSDRYQYDVAAYRLDRILGLDMVPPAVLRSIDGEEGVVQYWVENTINERDRQARNVPYTGYCSPTAQYNLMNVFDVLIHNDDRNLSNVLHQRPEWKLWLIDHTRAFRSSRSRPDYLQRAELQISPELRAAIEGLDEDRLEPLRAYLHPRQIQGILARASRLLR